jgi:hypothetical protein
MSSRDPPPPPGYYHPKFTELDMYKSRIRYLLEIKNTFGISSKLKTKELNRPRKSAQLAFLSRK